MEDQQLVEEIRGLRVEIQEFRSDVASWRQDTGERIATIESQLRPAILGNGQPSRLAVVEKQVGELNQARYTQGGIVAALSALWAVIVFGLPYIRAKLGF